MRDPIDEYWFGPQPALSAVSPAEAERALRAAGDDTLADDLAASANSGTGDAFAGVDNFLDGLLNRVTRTTTLCGVVPAGTDKILPVARATPNERLRNGKLRISLEGLHVAKYPGRGRHNILFDFGVECHLGEKSSRVLHYNAKFHAHDGETVPVRNLPLFLGVSPGPEGIVFGFQTVNVASDFDEKLLGFLDGEEFKQGLTLVTAALPVLGQVSEMTVGLTRWLAGQSKNIKVQEFRQGLDFRAPGSGGCLVEGSYVVVQVPLEFEREWDWANWRIDPTLLRLVQVDEAPEPLNFNHLIFGVHAME